MPMRTNIKPGTEWHTAIGSGLNIKLYNIRFKAPNKYSVERKSIAFDY